MINQMLKKQSSVNERHCLLNTHDPYGASLYSKIEPFFPTGTHLFYYDINVYVHLYALALLQTNQALHMSTKTRSM